MKNLFDWFTEDDDEVIVKSLTSKGIGKEPIEITVGDIRKGRAKDSSGYENEVVLFVRANKADRKAARK